MSEEIEGLALLISRSYYTTDNRPKSIVVRGGSYEDRIILRDCLIKRVDVFVFTEDEVDSCKGHYSANLGELKSEINQAG